MKVIFYQLIALFSSFAYGVGGYNVLKISFPDPRLITSDTTITVLKEIKDCEICFITRIEPSPALKFAHHFTVSVCDDVNGTQCNAPDVSILLAAWITDLSAFELPRGTGFRVGKKTSRRYVRVLVHFYETELLDDESASNLWFKIYTTDEKLQPTQSILLESTGGEMPPGQKVSFYVSCTVPSGIELRILRYRVHTHDLGLSVAGYVVKNCQHKCQWNLIGKAQPTLSSSQKFLPVENKALVAKGGDILTVRCVFYNKRNKTVKIGFKASDEMCDYIIFAINEENDDEFTFNNCVKPGPLDYTWKLDPRLNNIPDDEY